VYKKNCKDLSYKTLFIFISFSCFFWLISIPVTNIVLETLENVPSHENVVFYFLLCLIFSFCILLLINYLVE